MEIVNGYHCLTCADVAFAQRRLGPAHSQPPTHPARPAGGAAAQAHGPAVVLAGALASSAPVRAEPAPAAVRDAAHPAPVDIRV